MPIPPPGRKFKSLAEAQEYYRKHVESYNRTPQDEMDGLSPLQMKALLRRPFSPDSPLAWQESVAGEVLDAVPFLELATRLLEQADTGKGIKLTAKGNLPRKLVLEWYDLGILRLEHVEKGIVIIRSEEDVFIFPSLRHTVQLAKLVKKRHSYLSTTALGSKLRAPEHRLELLQLLFRTHFEQFNLAYFDGYNVEEGMQQFIGFYLRLLLRYGGQSRPIDFYVDKIITAFPQLLKSIPPNRFFTPRDELASCFKVRILLRFLWLYGLVEGDLEKIWEPNDPIPPKVKAIATLRALMST